MIYYLNKFYYKIKNHSWFSILIKNHSWFTTLTSYVVSKIKNHSLFTILTSYENIANMSNGGTKIWTLGVRSKDKIENKINLKNIIQF